MSNVELNLEEYLPRDRIREIAEEELKYRINRMIDKEADFNRIFVNLSYEYVFKMVEEQLDHNLADFLRDKILEIISNLSQFCIFRDDEYGRKKSVGTEIVDDIVKNSRPYIEERVHKIIDDMSLSQMNRDELSYTLAEYMTERLFEGRNDES